MMITITWQTHYTDNVNFTQSLAYFLETHHEIHFLHEYESWSLQQRSYNFPIVIHCCYTSILYCFRDTVTSWSKILNFYKSLEYWLHPLTVIPKNFGCGLVHAKPELWGYDTLTEFHELFWQYSRFMKPL